MEIFYSDIHGVRERFEEALACVPDALKARIAQSGNGAGMLTAALLAKRCLGADEEKPVRHTRAGKPYLDQGPAFSISYSGNIAVLLTAETDCGVDTEPLDGTGRRGPVEVLTEDELWWLQDQLHNYMTLWTRKEAALKAYGDMEAADPASFTSIAQSNSITIGDKCVYVGSYAAGGNVISWAAEKLGIPALIYFSTDELIK